MAPHEAHAPKRERHCSFYLTTAQFGPNFYIGNSVVADGTDRPLRPGRGFAQYERADATDLAVQAEGRPLTPAEVSGYWTRRAFGFIQSNPTAWLALMGRKLALLGNGTEVLDTVSQESYSQWSNALHATGLIGRFALLLPLAVLGIAVTWTERRRIWVLYALTAGYIGSVAIFYGFSLSTRSGSTRNVRYSIPPASIDVNPWPTPGGMI